MNRQMQNGIRNWEILFKIIPKKKKFHIPLSRKIQCYSKSLCILGILIILKRIFQKKKKWQKTLNLETFLFTDKELDTSKHHKTQKMMYLLLKPSLKLSVQCTFYPVQVINCHLQLGFLSQLSIYFLFYILQYLNFLNSSYVKMLFRLNDHPFVLVKILNCSI